jgi:rod shape-determining protein MreC
MLRLFEFLYQRRIFGLFLVLQVISLWLIFSYNHRYNTYFLNSSNRISGEILTKINNVKTYFGLQQINAELAKENLELRRLLSKGNLTRSSDVNQSDSADYRLAIGKVVNASFQKSRNYLTLRIQPEDSIQPGMGVLSARGVVGRVKSVSTHFATVVSILNPTFMVSGRVKTNRALCTVQWDGVDPLLAQLKYVPRHLDLTVGDTVVTSGFNTVFPAEYPVGIVVSRTLRQESPFYDAKVRLLTDFTTIETVYIAEVLDSDELLLLEEELPNE